jgi:hypothetical protein
LVRAIRAEIQWWPAVGLWSGDLDGSVGLGPGGPERYWLGEMEIQWACRAREPSRMEKVYGVGVWQTGCSLSKLWHGEAFHN